MLFRLIWAKMDGSTKWITTEGISCSSSSCTGSDKLLVEVLSFVVSDSRNWTNLWTKYLLALHNFYTLCPIVGMLIYRHKIIFKLKHNRFSTNVLLQPRFSVVTSVQKIVISYISGLITFLVFFTLLDIDNSKDHFVKLKHCHLCFLG